MKPDGTVASSSTIEGRRKLNARVGEFQREGLRFGTIRPGMKLSYWKDIGRLHRAVTIRGEGRATQLAADLPALVQEKLN